MNSIINLEIYKIIVNYTTFSYLSLHLNFHSLINDSMVTLSGISLVCNNGLKYLFSAIYLLCQKIDFFQVIFHSIYIIFSQKDECICYI